MTVELFSEAFYQAVNPTVSMVGFQRSEPAWQSVEKDSIKDCFDLWYIASGLGEVNIDGRWIAFGAGDLVAIKPGENYLQERADADDPFVVYYAFVLPFGPGQGAWDGALGRQWPAKMSLAHRPGIATQFAELFETFTARPEGYAIRCKALMLTILDAVFEVLRQRLTPVPPRSYEQLLRARDYIQEHYRSAITLDEVAGHCDLSGSYLSALFRRYFRCSPIQYQIRCRLRRARLMLARGVPVTQVAGRTGFNSIHYFSRTFKKHFGQSPSSFAESRRRK